MSSVWETRFQNHALWSLVDQLQDQLEQVAAPEDVDGADSLSRLQWVMGVLEAHRTNEDARGYTPTMLDTIQQRLSSSVQNNLAQYLADPTTYGSYLRTAADNVDAVLDQMGSWPPLSSKGAAIAAGQAAAAYEKTSKAALSELVKARDKLNTDLKSLAAEVAAEKAELDALRTRYEENAGTAITGKLDELTESFNDSVDATVNGAADALKSAESSRSALEQMESEGRTILEAVANKAVAHDYRENARNKSVAGWVWDGIGLVIGGTSLTLLLVHLFDKDAGTTTTSLALTRLAVSIAGLGLAALCFQRGSNNHLEARRAKRADLRLSTVRPFIANQDEEFQDTIVQGMADRIYLQGILDDATESNHDGSLYDLYLKRLRERRATAETAAEEA